MINLIKNLLFDYFTLCADLTVSERVRMEEVKARTTGRVSNCLGSFLFWLHGFRLAIHKTHYHKLFYDYD